MFHHHKELAYTARVDKPNAIFARMLQQAIGGLEGEMRVMNQYLFEARGARGPKKYRDMFLHTGTEEIGHIEMLATAVAMNLDGLPPRRSTTSSRTRSCRRAWVARAAAFPERRARRDAGRRPTACRSTRTASTSSGT